MPTCETCRWYAGVLSECRLHAPAPKRDDARLRIWPVVQVYDWCGDHEPRTKES